jgi:transcriptional regulator with XRE-family HTH domain
MRPSPFRHPVAVLRNILEMSQTEFGALSDCSSRTIQAVELGKLPLSESLALRIAHSTGISIEWLLKGDPAAPPKADCPSGISSPDGGFAYEVYEAHRAALEIENRSASGGGRENTSEQLFSEKSFREDLAKRDAELVVLCKDLLGQTVDHEKRSVIRWRLKEFLNELTSDFVGSARRAARRKRAPVHAVRTPIPR